MSIAIIGGTGFLGTAIAAALRASGAEVVQVARGSAGRDPAEGCAFAAADRRNREALMAIFQHHNVRTVIDVMTLTLGDTQPLLAATADVGARYVMISAIDVIANYGGLTGLETPAPLLRPTREDDPLRSVPYPYRHIDARPAGIDPITLHDYDKIPIEHAARSDPSLRALILRLPAICGPGDRQGRFGWLASAIKPGGRVEMDARAAQWAQSFIYIDDAAAAVAEAALSDAEPATFNVATQRVWTMGDWAVAYARHHGFDATLVDGPPDVRGALSERADATDMRYPLTLDGGKFAARFGPVARTPDQKILATLIDR